MQKQKGAKIGAFVFFCFGVMMLALGVWGITTLYDQGGILTWGIVLGFGLIFALTGVVLFINSMESVSNRVKQLLGCILGTLVFMSFGFVGLFAKGLGVMRLFLLFFGGIGVLLLIQGIRNFIKGDSGDADQKSGRVQWSGGVGGRINGQEMDGGYQPCQTPEYGSYDGEYNDQSGYNGQSGYNSLYGVYGSQPADIIIENSEKTSPGVTDTGQNSQWQQGTPGTPFSGDAGNKVYTSQVNSGGTVYGSGMSPEFDQMMNGMGMDPAQREQARKVGSAVRKGANIYAGVICIVVGAGFILVNGISVLSFIFMLIQTASLTIVMGSLFPTVMSAALLIVGVFMIVRGVKILREK